MSCTGAACARLRGADDCLGGGDHVIRVGPGFGRTATAFGRAAFQKFVNGAQVVDQRLTITAVKFDLACVHRISPGKKDKARRIHPPTPNSYNTILHFCARSAIQSKAKQCNNGLAIAKPCAGSGAEASYLWPAMIDLPAMIW
jgi:hypothetical protein